MLLEEAFFLINNEEKKNPEKYWDWVLRVCVQKTTTGEQNLFDSGPWLRCSNYVNLLTGISLAH